MVFPEHTDEGERERTGERKKREEKKKKKRRVRYTHQKKYQGQLHLGACKTLPYF